MLQLLTKNVLKVKSLNNIELSNLYTCRDFLIKIPLGFFSSLYLRNKMKRLKSLYRLNIPNKDTLER